MALHADDAEWAGSEGRYVHHRDLQHDALIVTAQGPLLHVSEQRLAGVLRNGSAGFVAQTNEVVPVGGIACCRRLVGWRGRSVRVDRRRQSDRHVRGARKIRAIAQKFSGTRERNRNDRHVGTDGGFERAELKWTNAVFFREGTFRKNENGFAFLQQLRDLFGLLQTRVAFGAIEPDVTHLFEERADERHVAHFEFRDKMVGNSEPEHQRQNVEIARVIRGVDLGAGRVHILLADNTHATSDHRKQNLERGGCEAARSAFVFDKADDRAGWNDPNEKDEHEIDAVEDLPYAVRRGRQHVAGLSQSSSGAEPNDLDPNGRTTLRKRSFFEELTRLFSSQFSTGSFRNAVRGNELHAVGWQAEPARNLIGDRGRNRPKFFWIAIAHFGDDDQFFGA